jgi:hypothetical protein
VISTQSWEDARTVWDYHRMHHTLRPCSVAVGLGSHDLGVADTAAGLYHRCLAPLVLFTGSTSPTTREAQEVPAGVVAWERPCEAGFTGRLVR